MASTSAEVAGRPRSSPMTRRRRVPCPVYEATFTAAGVVPSDWKKSASGRRDPPSWPTTTVVTPWLTSARASGCSSSPRSWWEWVSMKPGARTIPPPSTTRSPRRGESSPTATMVSPSMRTAPW